MNLEAVYPEVGKLEVEHCFEELRARHRGWMDVDWRRERRVDKQRVAEPQREESCDARQESTVEVEQSLPAEQVTMEESGMPPPQKQRGFAIFEDALEQPVANTTSERADEVLVRNVLENACFERRE